MTTNLARLYKARFASRCFSTSPVRREIKHISELPDRIYPTFQETNRHDLLALQWHSPPRNVLVVRKDGSSKIDDALFEYASHIHSTYQGVSLVFEPSVAHRVHESFNFPIYTTQHGQAPNTSLHDKIDLTTTLGGDGTILHASSLFAAARSVPPILSFSMGTLGFLGEWKFNEYKRAFRELYMSGATAGAGSPTLHAEVSDRGSHHEQNSQTSAGWSSIRGQSMGLSRCSRVLLRNRLKVGIFAPDGSRVPHQDPSDQTHDIAGDIYALNEVLIHRGRTPHLSMISIWVGGRFLTEAVADGMLISTPTGSTAYSLSSGGSIVHPLVSSLLLTPICPRSLSFRPLVLPANTPITLRLSEANRGEEVEVSIDGVRRTRGLERGMEVRVLGEEIKTDKREWSGGVPSVVRAGGASGSEAEDPWVGGLNRLLKFNYPFGEDG